VRFSFSVFASCNILAGRCVACAASHCTAQRESRAEGITYRVVASLDFSLLGLHTGAMSREDFRCQATLCLHRRRTFPSWRSELMESGSLRGLADTKLKNMRIFCAESQEQVTAEALVVARRERDAKEKMVIERISFFLVAANG
jgi:hypothetical protein